MHTKDQEYININDIWKFLYIFLLAKRILQSNALLDSERDSQNLYVWIYQTPKHIIEKRI